MSPESVRPVRNGPEPLCSNTSTMRGPPRSETWICSTLQDVVSAQGSPSTSIGVQADGPPEGSVEVITWPTASVATHSEVDGQEIDVSRWPPSIIEVVHAPAGGS